jgi:hypothetical protein
MMFRMSFVFELEKAPQFGLESVNDDDEVSDRSIVKPIPGINDRWKEIEVCKMESALEP